MKLKFRGNTYEMLAPIQLVSDSTNDSKTLFYRGRPYNYTPPSMLASKVDTTDWKTVTLTYRGTTYQRKLQPTQPYQTPRAINWRYQIPTEG